MLAVRLGADMEPFKKVIKVCVGLLGVFGGVWLDRVDLCC